MARPLDLLWTPRAIADLDEAYDFLEDRSPAAARKLIDRIDASLNRLSRHPYLGRTGMVEGTRELSIPRTNYIVVYRITNAIELLAVVHTAQFRDPSQG